MCVSTHPKNMSTAQEDADERKPRITSWEHVAELTTRDFKQAEALMIPLIPRGEWVSDHWSRGGKVAYKGQPKCAWRRRQTKDGKHIVRLIQYKNIMVLQKAVLPGAEDEKQQEEEEENQEDEAEDEAKEVIIGGACQGCRR